MYKRQGTPSAVGGKITWQSQISAGEKITVTYVMSPVVDAALLTPITNTVTFDGGLHGPFTRQTQVQYAHLLRLPLITTNH